MKKISICLFLTAAFCGFAFAQKDQGKTAVKAEQKQAKQPVAVSTSAVSLAPSQAQKEEKPAEKKNPKAAKEKVQEEDEYAEVMIDTPDPDAYKAAYLAEERRDDEPSLPYLYGALKGSFNDGAKNILVFENDEGIITFVQIFLDKNAVSWKYLNQINRN